MRRLLRPVYVLISVLVVVVLAVTVVVTVQNKDAQPLPDPAVARTAASVAFIGDSFTAGTADGGRGPANYTSLLASRNGWEATNAAVDGSGYVAGSTFAAQLPKIVTARPQTVVVVGGRADYSEDPSAVRSEATRLYADIGRQLPQTVVVVVGPIWPATDAPLRARSMRDAVRQAAATAKVPFVDPIADGWFNGPDIGGVAPDGEHLNDDGHRRLADLVGNTVREFHG